MQVPYSRPIGDPDMDVQLASPTGFAPRLDQPHSARPAAARVRSTIVIPARLASTRLPRKLLLRDTGKPLIQHTYEAASCSARAGGVLVAADCEEIASV